jgi:hypothetical protein
MFHTEVGTVGNCELDSHADTCVAGANFLASEFNGITCEIVPFTNDYKPMKNIPIVSAATTWTNEETGEVLIVFFLSSSLVWKAIDKQPFESLPNASLWKTNLR